MESYDHLIKKWSPVLNEETAGSISDYHRKAVTAAVLENQEKAFMEEAAQSQTLNEAAPGNNTGSAQNWNPVLIALVRRAMPNLMAYDLCGVQPMSGPTGLIFAMKSRYGAGSTSSTEALFQEANTAYSGDSTGAGAHAGDASGLGSAADGTGGAADSALDSERVTNITGRPMPTGAAEALGSGAPSADFQEMGFTIEKATVTAKSRALKAEYTLELAQDLKAIHGLDAETELANILSTEILAEINREVIRTIN